MARRKRNLSASVGVFIALFAGGTASAQESPARRPIVIEDDSGRALDAFHAALDRARRRRGRLRISVWGASHTASDQFTGELRAAWQRRFGDAGPGLALPAVPFRLYEHRQVRLAPTGAWRPVRVRGRHRPEGAYGPAGFAIETTRAAAAFVELEEGVPEVDHADLYFLRQPGGGRLAIRVDGGRRRVVQTAGDHADRIRLDGPLRRVELRALGDGPVRVFGVSLERDAPGVIVDAMGVPGARLRDRLPWRDAPMRRQLRTMAPDLVVLAYGTNESGFRGRLLRRYLVEVEEALRRARATAPGASCLLIGPSDWPEREGGVVRDRARTARVIQTQREVAAAEGCAFVDLVAWMGGPTSMVAWVRAGLALDDHVHFTDEGHRRLAGALSQALLHHRAGAPAPAP